MGVVSPMDKTNIYHCSVIHSQLLHNLSDGTHPFRTQHLDRYLIYLINIIIASDPIYEYTKVIP